MKVDQRASPRTNLQIAMIEVEHLPDGTIHLSQGKDLSTGGLLVRTPDTLEEGSSVAICFWNPVALQRLRARGVVVRTLAKQEMAFRFVDLPIRVSQVIARYVNLEREWWGGSF